MNARTVRFVFACTLVSGRYDPSTENIHELITGRRGTHGWHFYRKVAMHVCQQLGVDDQLLADMMGRPISNVRMIYRETTVVAENCAKFTLPETDPFREVWRVMTPSGCDVVGDPS